MYLQLLIPWSRVLFEKLTGSQLVYKFPTFYGNRSFIPAFTSARHLSLSWARSIQPMHPSHFLKMHLSIILQTTPRSSKCSFAQVSQPKSCIHLSPPHTCYIRSPSPRFDHLKHILWGLQIIKLLIMWFSPLPCYLVPLRPKYSSQRAIL
jgi:hypothetical protein